MKNKTVKEKTDKKKVFLVDDHPIVREGLTQLINRELDLVVCGEAGDVATAIEKIPEIKPDTVVVDLSLEQGSGIKLIESLVYSDSALPILVLSMHDESIYAERCLKAGAKGYIMKQAPSRKMISALRRVLDGEIYVSDELGEKILHKLFSDKTEKYETPLDSLSNREFEVYQLLGKGLKKKEVAESLNLGLKTLETYVEHIKRKMTYKSSHELLSNAFKFMNESAK